MTALGLRCRVRASSRHGVQPLLSIWAARASLAVELGLVVTGHGPVVVVVVVIVVVLWGVGSSQTRHRTRVSCTGASRTASGLVCGRTLLRSLSPAPQSHSCLASQPSCR